MTARAVLAGGLVTLSVWNTATQAWGPWGDALDADKFAIKPNSEKKSSTSKSHLNYGQSRAAVVIPKPTELSIAISAASATTLAMQFQGIVESLTQSAGNLTAHEVTVTALGDWLPVGKRNLVEEGFGVFQTDGTTALAAGTFEVNWARGEIRVKSGVTVGDKIKLTSAYNAVDGKKILGGRMTQIRCRARFDGANLVDGAPVEVDVHEAVLGAGNEFDFLSDNFTATELSGEIVVPTGKTEGYEVRWPTLTA
ncbi:MAG: hypothetical protein LWW96_14310 [Acidovorax sp.]|uniref:phage tail tube protein n=1 Tax=Acidovorax sp. TaxID=1872122 RepID=UPI0025C2DF41|nr:hypothetical protein [Acidovorax sp.]MCE1193316.1 hypothetical protein [Acidovorax sp.]